MRAQQARWSGSCCVSSPWVPPWPAATAAATGRPRSRPRRAATKSRPGNSRAAATVVERVPAVPPGMFVATHEMATTARHEAKTHESASNSIESTAMNRTGLLIALTVAVAVGLLFGLYPKLDLDLSALFYDP